MQAKLYSLSFIVLLVVTFSSCKKWLPENRIEGSWQLTEIQKRRPFANENVQSQYKSGTMQGSWEIRKVDNGYTDSDGNWQSQTRNVLWVKLYDFSSNRVIDWYFDKIDFRNSGQRLFAFMDGSGYDYRYCFSKR